MGLCFVTSYRKANSKITFAWVLKGIEFYVCHVGHFLPIGPICFGDIGPCKGNRPSCVTRQFVLNTCGAKPGDYKILFKSVKYGVTYEYEEESCFEFKLCKG